MNSSSIFFKVLQLAVLTASTVAWSYYLGFYIRVAYANKNLLLDSQIDLMSAGALFIFISIFGSISFLISYRMLKTKSITKTHLGIILISGIIFSSIFIIEYGWKLS